MKKFLLLLLFLVGLTAQAAQISVNEARLAAAAFFGESIDSTRQANIRKAQGINTAYYIFTSEANDAFVILSGDTRMPQVLAYSRENGLDTESMPPQLPALLNAYSEVYRYAVETDTDITELPRSSAPVLYKTAKWGQNAPFNKLCPNSYTGCGATAMAIKMKYHNYPQRGYGSHSYENNGKTLSMDFNFDMNFSLMNTDFANGTYNQSQADAVAKLMYACGVAVDMEYGLYESWSYTTNMVMMSKYFGYANEIETIDGSKFSRDQWFELLDNELDNVGPVIYRGADLNDNGGHIFLIDGRENDKYHINWGWNGSYNGYFNLSVLKPSYNNYSYNHWMVINAKPENTGNFTPLSIWANTTGFDLTYNKERVVANEPFFAMSNYIINRDNEDHTGYLALALTDKSGKPKSILRQSPFELYASYIFPSVTYQDIASSVSGDHGDLLAMVYKLDGESEWHTVLSGIGGKATASAWDNKPQYVPITWNVDPLISIANTRGQERDKALKNLPYTFVLSYSDEDVTDVQVTVNGEPLSGMGNWYTIPLASADGYVIKISGKHTSVSEIIDDEAGEVRIYNLGGILLQTAPCRSAAEDALHSLPKGIYLLKADSKTEKCVN